MTCTTMRMVHICTHPHGRLKLGNRYVWVDFHEYCGPVFSRDANGTKPYEPADENDPVWTEFGKWLDKLNAAKVKQAQQMKAKNAR